MDLRKREIVEGGPGGDLKILRRQKDQTDLSIVWDAGNKSRRRRASPGLGLLV